MRARHPCVFPASQDAGVNLRMGCSRIPFDKGEIQIYRHGDVYECNNAEGGRCVYGCI